ncbi:MAG: GNAT family N-acetyltransferase, partial [Methylococcales bacterium]|nr:GNAT family N-acetyltransferase [Methylococcales bacterium]
MSDIEFRRLNEGLIPDLQWLLKTVQHADFTQEYLRKKYDHSYLGMMPLAIMAYDGAQVVGCYCAVPQQFRSEQGTVLWAHLCDFYTVPSHQRQGLNARMGKQLVKIAKTDGIRFFTVFHSAATHRSSRSVGLKGLGMMQGYALDIEGFPLHRVVRKLRNQTHPSPEQIEKVLGPFRMDAGGYHNSNADKGGVWHDYREAFFAYKCFTPNLHIQLPGARFWVQAGGEMLIGDAVFDTEAGLKGAISELQSMGRRLGQRKLIF